MRGNKFYQLFFFLFAKMTIRKMRNMRFIELVFYSNNLFFGNFSVALVPFVDHAKERFMLIWNATSSMSTQLLA
jgi:hypothetical protein